MSGLDWTQTVCKCYRQTALADKVLNDKYGGHHIRKPSQNNVLFARSQKVCYNCFANVKYALLETARFQLNRANARSRSRLQVRMTEHAQKSSPKRRSLHDMAK